MIITLPNGDHILANTITAVRIQSREKLDEETCVRAGVIVERGRREHFLASEDANQCLAWRAGIFAQWRDAVGGEGDRPDPVAIDAWDPFADADLMDVRQRWEASADAIFLPIWHPDGNMLLAISESAGDRGWTGIRYFKVGGKWQASVDLKTSAGDDNAVDCEEAAEWLANKGRELAYKTGESL